jgi:hypothetical protein
MRLQESEKEKLRTETVEVLLSIRAAYLAQGANALKHWTQLSDRMRGAVRTSESPEEWYTTMLRTLQIRAAPSLLSSTCLLELADHVRELGAASEWLDMVEREYGLLIAMARKTAEERRDREHREDAHGTEKV